MLRYFGGIQYNVCTEAVYINDVHAVFTACYHDKLIPWTCKAARGGSRRHF